MNKIVFTYLGAKDVSKLENIFYDYTDMISVLTDDYILTTTDGHEDIHYCTICDIPYSDIMSYPDVAVQNTYDKMRLRFGEEMDRFVYTDETKIIDKIRDILSFAMHKVYKCDEMMVITEISDQDSSIPPMIAHVCKDNFNIIKQCESIEANHHTHQLIIKDKEK